MTSMRDTSTTARAALAALKFSARISTIYWKYKRLARRQALENQIQRIEKERRNIIEGYFKDIISKLEKHGLETALSHDKANLRKDYITKITFLRKSGKVRGKRDLRMACRTALYLATLKFPNIRKTLFEADDELRLEAKLGLERIDVKTFQLMEKKAACRDKTQSQFASACRR